MPKTKYVVMVKGALVTPNGSEEVKYEASGFIDPAHAKEYRRSHEDSIRSAGKTVVASILARMVQA